MTKDNPLYHVIEPLYVLDEGTLNRDAYAIIGSAAVILTHDNHILLQQRDEGIAHFPGFLGTFGGGRENDETPFETLCRELNEETGGTVRVEDTVYFGPLHEQFPDHAELVDCYFWHDKEGTITGCYEGAPRHFASVAEALTNSPLMDDVVWMLEECRGRGLLR